MTGSYSGAKFVLFSFFLLSLLFPCLPSNKSLGDVKD